MRHQLLRLNGIGVGSASILAREVYYRQFANRRQVGSYLGVTPSAYDSGESRRSQGISKVGNRLARRAMIQVAWLWIRHQPESQLTKWFRRRTEGQSKRMRCVMIVALARKLAIALWRYLETGPIPERRSPLGLMRTTASNNGKKTVSTGPRGALAGRMYGWMSVRRECRPPD